VEVGTNHNRYTLHIEIILHVDLDSYRSFTPRKFPGQPPPLKKNTRTISCGPFLWTILLLSAILIGLKVALKFQLSVTAPWAACSAIRDYVSWHCR